jgi:hypothetical protein
MKRIIRITPWWLTGFTQADGSFIITFEKRKEGLLPYRPVPVFIITQSLREKELMLEIQKYLGVGYLYPNRDSYNFVIKSLEVLLNVIIPHFDKYPMRGDKQLSYQIFRKVVFFMKEGKHRDLKGFLSILELCYFSHSTSKRSTISKQTILDSLIATFNTLPEFPIISLDLDNNINKQSIEPDFIAGLLDGDGSLNFSFSSTRRRIVSNFTIVQPVEDSLVLEEIKTYFSCGKVYSISNKMSRFQIENSTLLLTVIGPFLKKVHLNTIKQEYIGPCLKAWKILSEEGIKTDTNLTKVVDLVYDLNLEGIKRKVSKENYLKKVLK